MAYDEKLAERIRTIISGRPDVEERRMFGGVAFMVRGHMSCGVVGPTLMVRHSPEDAEHLLREPHARPMDFTGRPMRGFLYVDPAGTRTASALGTWIQRATAWAAAQPSKAPGKRPTRQRSKR
jgi:TfoX/Sxy family transcriptional regulator of competence genes